MSINYWMLKAPRPLVGWSEVHGHGWGIGWYEKGQAQLEKAPGPAQKSERFAQLAHSIESSLFVCHLRKATCGEQTVCNSQPFRFGNWLFGHNGTVDRDRLIGAIGPEAATLEGETDSEVYFRWLINKYAKSGIDGLKEGIRFVRGGSFTALNFVASDGANLFGYWEKSPDAHTDDPDYYQLYWLQTTEPAPSIVICSEKLDDRDWKRLPLRSLLAAASTDAPRIIPLG